VFKLDIVPALVPVGELVRLVSSQLVRASKVSLQKVRLSKEARDLPDCLSFDPRSDCVKDEVGRSASLSCRVPTEIRAVLQVARRYMT
jgi:hypothetical protein